MHTALSFKLNIILFYLFHFIWRRNLDVAEKTRDFIQKYYYAQQSQNVAQRSF